MNAFNNQKPYRGVVQNKTYGWMYYECYNDGKTSDFRQFFEVEEDARAFALSRLPK